MFTLLLASALAQDDPPPPEEGTEGRAPRFVLVVEDLSRALEGKIVEATVGEVPRLLVDDGSGSDIHADDGLLCAVIPSQPQQEVRIRITVDGELLDEHTLRLGDDLELPSVRVDLSGDSPVWRVQEDEPVFTGEDEDDDAWYIDEDEIPELDRWTPSTEDHTVAAGAGLTAGSLLGGLLLLRGRRRRIGLRSLGSPPAKGQTESSDTETVVRALAVTTNVLLLPHPDSRPALSRALHDQPAALWMEIDRPSPQTVVAAADQLAQAGPLVLVVEGAEALEAPSSREAPLAAIEELKELCEYPVLLTT